MTIMRRISICYGLFSFIWKIFIRLDMVFPPLLNTIPSVRLDVFDQDNPRFSKMLFVKYNRTYQPTFCNSAKLKLKQKVPY